MLKRSCPSHFDEDAAKRSCPSHFDGDAEQTPPTPRTESELNFVCKVSMSSGRSLGSFKCDEMTSVGYIRRMVTDTLVDLHSKGELSFVSFELLRGAGILRNDYSKLYEQRDADKEDCLLTVVLYEKLNNAIGIISFDIAPSSRAKCFVCDAPILRGTLRLDYRFKRSNSLKDQRRFHAGCAGGIPAATRATDLIVVEGFLKRDDLVMSSRITLQQVAARLASFS